MSAEIFVTLTNLLRISQETTIANFDLIVERVFEAINDLTRSEKRVQALRCLASAVSNSGFVHIMYYKNNGLIDYLFSLLSSNSTVESKEEV